MAELRVEQDVIHVDLSLREKVEGVHGNVTVPRAAVRGVWVVPDGTREVHGLKLKGAGLTGVLKVGTFIADGRVIFAVAHGGRPAVVIDLVGQHFGRLVVTVDDPDQVLVALGVPPAPTTWS